MTTGWPRPRLHHPSILDGPDPEPEASALVTAARIMLGSRRKAIVGEAEPSTWRTVRPMTACVLRADHHSGRVHHDRPSHGSHAIPS
jgi:hypothetical protein